MAATSKPTPKDASGIYPLPSAYNAASDRHEVVRGAAGAVNTRVPDGADEALGSRSDAPAGSGDLSAEHTAIALEKEQLAVLRSINAYLSSL